MNEIEEWRADAEVTLNAVRLILESCGLASVDVEPIAMLAGGAAIGWQEGGFSVVTVGLGGSESLINIATGAMKDVPHDRLSILETCNACTRDNPLFPVYLHDAEIGWDILVHQRWPLEAFGDSPGLLGIFLQVQQQKADEAREKGLARSLEGGRFVWDDDDIKRLAISTVF